MGAAKTRGGILIDEDTYEEAKTSINVDYTKLEEIRVKVIIIRKKTPNLPNRVNQCQSQSGNQYALRMLVE